MSSKRYPEEFKIEAVKQVSSRCAGGGRSIASGSSIAWCTTSRNWRITGTGSRGKGNPPRPEGARQPDRRMLRSTSSKA